MATLQKLLVLFIFTLGLGTGTVLTANDADYYPASASVQPPAPADFCAVSADQCPGAPGDLPSVSIAVPAH